METAEVAVGASRRDTQNMIRGHLPLRLLELHGVECPSVSVQTSPGEEEYDASKLIGGKERCNRDIPPSAESQYSHKQQGLMNIIALTVKNPARYS